jgi:hypothetical protein
MTLQRAGRGRTRRAWLLRAGFAAPAVYAAGDLLSGRAYCGYRFRDQAISELSAYGSPVRTAAVAWITLHELLQLAFGAGVWLSADGNRALRWTAGCSLAANGVTAPLHPFFPMSSRGMAPGFNDTMHQALTLAFVPLVCGAVGASALACPGWFRRYALASLALIVGSGGSMGPLLRALAENRPTPGLGALERVNAYTMHAWTVVLAGVLMRRTLDANAATSGRFSG